MPLHDLTPHPRGETTFTLVLLHHAGGSSMGFAPLLPHLPRYWRVLGADLPGRLLDRGGAHCYTAQNAVDHLREALSRELGGPYAVFGHSLGALLAFELVRRLETEGHAPRRLAVSGSLAPRTYGGTGRVGAHLAERVLRHTFGPNGGPAAIERTPLAELAERTLRRDLRILEDYRYAEGPPLRTPLSVFGGSLDPLAPADRLHHWSAHSSHPVAYHVWPGGHSYLHDHAEQVGARIVESCRTSYSRRPVSADR